MTIFLSVFGAVVMLAAIAVVLLRLRKVKRDGERTSVTGIELRLVTPPPSPYATSKGFRVVEESGGEEPHREPIRPRLEADREYVFNDSQLLPLDLPERAVSRRRDEWALARSAHRPRVHVTTRRVIVSLVAALVVIGVLAYGVRRLVHGASVTTSSTTSTTSPSLSLHPSVTSGRSATYQLLPSTYLLTVAARGGSTWVRVVVGPQATTQFQGVVTPTKRRQWSLHGNVIVTLATPGHALVSINGATVALPTPLPTTLALHFQAGSAPG